MNTPPPDNTEPQEFIDRSFSRTWSQGSQDSYVSASSSFPESPTRAPYVPSGVIPEEDRPELGEGEPDRGNLLSLNSLRCSLKAVKKRFLCLFRLVGEWFLRVGEWFLRVGEWFLRLPQVTGVLSVILSCFILWLGLCEYLGFISLRFLLITPLVWVAKKIPGFRSLINDTSSLPEQLTTIGLGLHFILALVSMILDPKWPIFSFITTIIVLFLDVGSRPIVDCPPIEDLNSSWDVALYIFGWRGLNGDGESRPWGTWEKIGLHFTGACVMVSWCLVASYPSFRPTDSSAFTLWSIISAACLHFSRQLFALKHDPQVAHLPDAGPRRSLNKFLYFSSFLLLIVFIVTSMPHSAPINVTNGPICSCASKSTEVQLYVTPLSVPDLSTTASTTIPTFLRQIQATHTISSNSPDVSKSDRARDIKTSTSPHSSLTKTYHDELT